MKKRKSLFIQKLLLFLLFNLLGVLSASAQTLFSVNTHSYSIQDLEHFSQYAGIHKEPFAVQVHLFLRFQLKLAEAEQLGLKSSRQFKTDSARYRRSLIKQRMEVRGVSENQSIDRDEKILTAHILVALPPRASALQKQLSKEQLTQIEDRLARGDTFSDVAKELSDDSFSAPSGGQLPWLTLDDMIPEYAEAVSELENEGDISGPIQTPFGWHIIRLLSQDDPEREIRLQQQSDEVLQSVESLDSIAIDSDQRIKLDAYCDNWLVTEISRQRLWILSPTENQLNEFFRTHKKQYRWEIPRYKGWVVSCANKELKRLIKKRLKHLSADSAQFYLEKEFNNEATPCIKVEKGLYLQGENLIVDRLVFKRKEIPADNLYPESFVVGKKLKRGPDTLDDVRQLVLSDYALYVENSWIDHLKESFAVEIDEDVLKTVNNK